MIEIVICQSAWSFGLASTVLIWNPEWEKSEGRHFWVSNLLKQKMTKTLFFSNLDVFMQIHFIGYNSVVTTRVLKSLEAKAVRHLGWIYFQPTSFSNREIIN